MTDQTERIRQLNDQFRSTLMGGQLLITSGIQSLGAGGVSHVIETVKHYADFTENNDPYGEHDFGAFDFQGLKVFWKIDYYDLSMEYGSPNAADPELTKRVLTIMLASEY